MHISVTAAAAARARERGRTGGRTDADHVALSWTLRLDRIGRGAAANALQLTFRRRRRRSGELPHRLLLLLAAAAAAAAAAIAWVQARQAGASVTPSVKRTNEQSVATLALVRPMSPVSLACRIP